MSGRSGCSGRSGRFGGSCIVGLEGHVGLIGMGV